MIAFVEAVRRDHCCHNKVFILVEIVVLLIFYLFLAGDCTGNGAFTGNLAQVIVKEAYKSHDLMEDVQFVYLLLLFHYYVENFCKGCELT